LIFTPLDPRFLEVSFATRRVIYKVDIITSRPFQALKPLFFAILQTQKFVLFVQSEQAKTGYPRRSRPMGMWCRTRINMQTNGRLPHIPYPVRFFDLFCVSNNAIFRMNIQPKVLFIAVGVGKGRF